MKKVIVILLFLIVIGAGCYGTWYFYDKNENQIEMNAQLTAQNSQIQAQLNTIGNLTTVYEVAVRCYSGDMIKETDLVPVSIPESACNETSIRDMSQLVGKYYKINVGPGTILTTDLLMEESDSLSKKRYTRELTFTSLPVGTVPGDYVDIRLMLPNGEEIPVFTHIRIKDIFETTCTFEVTEEENIIINAMIQDASNYSSYCCFYMLKYIEPGNDTNVVAFYPVQHEMENMVRFNPNVEDTTRCINETMRDHIDEVLLVYSNTENSAMSMSFINGIKTQMSAQLAMHNDWITGHTDESGEIVVEGESTSQSFDQAVGEAYDSLDQSITDLEAIQ